jgi:hypothetical protein
MPGKQPRKSTNIDLAELLETRNTGRYDELIRKARAYAYHDFKQHKYDPNCDYEPKMFLLIDLQQFPELADVRQAVMDGVYDEPTDEEDREMIRGYFLEDQSPDEMFRIMGLAVPTQEERIRHRK